MEQQATDLIIATRSALDQASALAVQYSFSILGAIILLIVGWVAASLISRWAYEGISRVRGIDETLARFFTNVVRYAFRVLTVVLVLSQFGVQTASIIAMLGAAGLAIGLALQGTLQNIAAGIMLLVLKPFRVGEYVDAGGIAGTVEEIGLFATEMTRFDGLYILAPNSQLWGAAVINYSRNGRRRNDITIGIGYDDDITLAQQTLIDLANADGRVLADPAPATFVAALGDWTVNVTLRYWTATSDFWQTSLDLTKAGKLAFDQHGISMPSPQRDVHIYTDGKGTAEQPALPLPAPDNGPRKTSS